MIGVLSKIVLLVINRQSDSRGQCLFVFNFLLITLANTKVERMAQLTHMYLPPRFSDY